MTDEAVRAGGRGAWQNGRAASHCGPCCWLCTTKAWLVREPRAPPWERSAFVPRRTAHRGTEDPDASVRQAAQAGATGTSQTASKSSATIFPSTCRARRTGPRPPLNIRFLSVRLLSTGLSPRLVQILRGVPPLFRRWADLADAQRRAEPASEAGS